MWSNIIQDLLVKIYRCYDWNAFIMRWLGLTLTVDRMKQLAVFIWFSCVQSSNPIKNKLYFLCSINNATVQIPPPYVVSLNFLYQHCVKVTRKSCEEAVTKADDQQELPEQHKQFSLQKNTSFRVLEITIKNEFYISVGRTICFSNYMNKYLS